MASVLEGDFLVFKARRDHKLVYCGLLQLNFTTALSIENNNFHYNEAIDSSVNQAVCMLQDYEQEGRQNSNLCNHRCGTSTHSL